MTAAYREPQRHAVATPARGAGSVPVMRLVLGSILILYLALGPAVVQVLDVDTELFLRWTMFNTGANPMCLVEYRASAPGGAMTRVDRFAWLGITDRDFAPPEVALIRSPEQALEVGRKLCRERPGSDLRVFARCPHQGAWEPALGGEANLCASSETSWLRR